MKVYAISKVGKVDTPYDLEGKHILKKRITFYVNHRKGHWVWHLVDKGFTSDGYSAPRGTGWILRGFTVYPAILHDFLCRKAYSDVQEEYGVHRKYADEVFLSYLLQERVSKWRSYTMYYAVRLKGKFNELRIKLK